MHESIQVTKQLKLLVEIIPISSILNYHKINTHDKVEINYNRLVSSSKITTFIRTLYTWKLLPYNMLSRLPPSRGIFITLVGGSFPRRTVKHTSPPTLCRRTSIKGYTGYGTMPQHTGQSPYLTLRLIYNEKKFTKNENGIRL